MTKKIRAADKVAALSILSKHFKIVGNDADEAASAAVAVAEKLQKARERLRRMREEK